MSVLGKIPKHYLPWFCLLINFYLGYIDIEVRDWGRLIFVISWQICHKNFKANCKLVLPWLQGASSRSTWSWTMIAKRLEPCPFVELYQVGLKTNGSLRNRVIYRCLTSLCLLEAGSPAKITFPALNKAVSMFIKQSYLQQLRYGSFNPLRKRPSRIAINHAFSTCSRKKAFLLSKGLCLRWARKGFRHSCTLPPPVGSLTGNVSIILDLWVRDRERERPQVTFVSAAQNSAKIA